MGSALAAIRDGGRWGRLVVAVRGGGRWRRLVIVIRFRRRRSLQSVRVRRALLSCVASLALRLALGEGEGASR